MKTKNYLMIIFTFLIIITIQTTNTESLTFKNDIIGYYDFTTGTNNFVTNRITEIKPSLLGNGILTDFGITNTPYGKGPYSYSTNSKITIQNNGNFTTGANNDNRLGISFMMKPSTIQNSSLMRIGKQEYLYKPYTESGDRSYNHIVLLEDGRIAVGIMRNTQEPPLFTPSYAYYATNCYTITEPDEWYNVVLRFGVHLRDYLTIYINGEICSINNTPILNYGSYTYNAIYNADHNIDGDILLYDEFNTFNTFDGLISPIVFVNGLYSNAQYSELYNNGDFLSFNEIFNIPETITDFPTELRLGLGDMKEINLNNYYTAYDSLNLQFTDIINSESVSMTIVKDGVDVIRFKGDYAIRLKSVDGVIYAQFYSYLTHPISYDMTFNIIGEEVNRTHEVKFTIDDLPDEEEEFTQISSIPDLGMGHNEVVNRYMKNYFTGFDRVRISFEDTETSQNVVLETTTTGTTKFFNESHLKVELIPTTYFYQGIINVNDVVLRITSKNNDTIKNMTINVYKEDETLSDDFTLTINTDLESPIMETKPIAIASPPNQVLDYNEVKLIRFSDYFIRESYDEVRAIIKYQNKSYVIVEGDFYSNIVIGNSAEFQIIPKDFPLGNFSVNVGDGYLRIRGLTNNIEDVEVTLRAINNYGFTDTTPFTVKVFGTIPGMGGGFNFNATTKLMIALFTMLIISAGGVMLGYFINQLKIMSFLTVFLVVGFAIYFTIIGFLPVWIIIMMFILASVVVASMIKRGLTGDGGD